MWCASGSPAPSLQPRQEAGEGGNRGSHASEDITAATTPAPVSPHTYQHEEQPVSHFARVATLSWYPAEPLCQTKVVCLKKQCINCF